jgi:hypothetical protein
MDDRSAGRPDFITYEAPRVVATFGAQEILAEAETGSVVFIIS